MFKRVPPLLLGFLMTALLLELLLHALPVSTGYDFGLVDADHPIVHGTARFRYTYSKDWNFHLANSGVLNNYGFRSAYDYVPDDRAVAVIGNSFIQADALTPSDTVTQRLGSLLRRPTYALGIDGASLADYLATAQWAATTFKARTLILLLTTGDLSHSCLPRLGGHYLDAANGSMTLALIDRPAQSRFKALVNESKLFRYVYDNLRAAANWSRGWQGAQDNDDRPANPAGLAALLGCTNSRFADTATQFLLHSFHQLEIDHAVHIIFALAPGYRREQLVAAGALRDVDLFARRAAAEGFSVVPLDGAFSAALRAQYRLDFLPIDGHWNAVAHALAAQTIATAMSIQGAAPGLHQPD